MVDVPLQQITTPPQAKSMKANAIGQNREGSTVASLLHKKSVAELDCGKVIITLEHVRLDLNEIQARTEARTCESRGGTLEGICNVVICQERGLPWWCCKSDAGQQGACYIVHERKGQRSYQENLDGIDRKDQGSGGAGTKGQYLASSDLENGLLDQYHSHWGELCLPEVVLIDFPQWANLHDPVERKTPCVDCVAVFG